MVKINFNEREREREREREVDEPIRLDAYTFAYIMGG